MSVFNPLTPIDQQNLRQALLDLAEICDAFDQLGKLAVVGDLLYSPGSTSHKALFKAIEKTARHLRHLPVIGESEVGLD
jgi:hypothetical protein